MNKVVSAGRCNILRECSREDCILKMLSRGYTPSPRTEKEKITNREIERSVGKGFNPVWQVTGNSVVSDIICIDFKEK